MGHGGVAGWFHPTPRGLYCAPGDVYIDPVRPVARAVVTHGHADHARPGNGSVLATPETVAIMRARFGEALGSHLQELRYGQSLHLGDVTLRLVPAGHVLGSAQVVLEHGGMRAVVSGDYKRRRDPTCPPFEVVPCDVFVSEATFGLPVFRHPPDEEVLGELLHSLEVFPERCHLVGAYALGKAQRILLRLRELGYDRPIWLHGALMKLTELYAAQGFGFGRIEAATGASREQLRGQIVLAPPSALGDRWSRRLPEPLTAMASGWMRIKARARQRRVEMPLVISDHADWDELNRTLEEVDAECVWITHGREEALVHECRRRGREAKALSLVGYEDEGEEA